MKRTIRTFCLGLLLCGFAVPALAQSVNPSGVDGHLVFPYWSTDHDTNTHLSVESPLGIRPVFNDETRNVVRIQINDEMGALLADFRTCLTGADVWTARIVPDASDDGGSLLEVVDSGRCDADLIQPTPKEERGMPTPATLDQNGMAMLSGIAGYAVAYVDPSMSLVDPDPIGVDDESPDPSAQSDNGNPRPISGTGVILDAMSGFASSYAATAFMCRADADNTATPYNDQLAPMMCSADDIKMALLDENKDLLSGRWSALNVSGIVTSRTKIILTFPGSNNLMYKGDNGVADAVNTVTAATGDDAGEVDFTDPVSLLLTNDEGVVVAHENDVMLDQTVNMCEVYRMPATRDMPEPDAMVICNDMPVIEEIKSPAGTFRLYNNTAPITLARTDNNPLVAGDGMEVAGLTFAAQTPDVALTPTDATDSQRTSQFAAIGLVMSFFKGGDMKLYDTLASIQAYRVETDATTGAVLEMESQDDSDTATTTQVINGL